ncbi:MAG: translation elongation factor Ts, partial [Planctomycetales bacterium]|nr:translation elongation factor Ts [Planctomycetales bacterium]
VTQNGEFIQLANDMAGALAASGGVASVDELLALPSPSKPGQTLGDQRSELFNRIREVFNVGRFARVEGATGGYSHNATTVSGVLLVVEGGSDQAAKDVSMHVAACNPVALSKEEIDPAVVEKEREILRAAALNEGKPENIVDKMVEGRLRSFFAEKALLEQPFVKDNAMTVAKYADDNGMKIKQFIHWELGRE